MEYSLNLKIRSLEKHLLLLVSYSGLNLFSFSLYLQDNAFFITAQVAGTSAGNFLHSLELPEAVSWQNIMAVHRDNSIEVRFYKINTQSEYSDKVFIPVIYK